MVVTPRILMELFVRRPYRQLAFILILACSHTVFGQAEGDSVSSPGSKPPKRVKILPVPAFGHSPETGTYIGAVSVFTLNMYPDSLTRESNAKLEINYTWKRQMILEAGWNYFFKREAWFTQGLLHYSKFPDLYYGIGERTADSAEISYQSRRAVVDVNFLKKIGPSLFIGPRIKYKEFHSISSEATAHYYPELKQGSNLGIGLTLLKDTRNNLLNASKGVYLEFGNTYNFSDESYLKTHLDLRTYKIIFKELVGAVRWYNELTAGNPPFYDYAMIGGDKLVRGYYLGRYREKNLSTIQAELRSRLVWRFGLALFGGVTKLYPQFSSFSLTDLKPNYGAGIRFLIDRKSNINLRLDYAFAEEHRGFYVSFGESF